MVTKENGVKINGSIKLIGFIVLIVASTVSVVTSIEGLRGDMRVNTTEIKNLREDVKSVGDRIYRVEDDLHEHIEEGK